MNPLYTAVATVTGGREGKGETNDQRLRVTLSMPKELGGSGGEGTNPEQLFALGYASCFESALRLVARMKKQPVEGSSITARVSLSKVDAGFRLGVELTGKLPGMGRDDAMALMQAAHQVCPYSNATRGNIDVSLHVEEG